MTYAKIKPEHYNKRLLNGWYLVGNELYTLQEVEKYAIPSEYYDEVDVPVNKVFYLFGARFASER